METKETCLLIPSIELDYKGHVTDKYLQQHPKTDREQGQVDPAPMGMNVEFLVHVFHAGPTMNVYVVKMK